MQIIAGPCAIESKEQISEIITKCDLSFVRGGIMKYRSDATTYQGNPEAIEWIRELKKQHNFIFTTEVFNDVDIHNYGDTVDIYQIGARNMYNTDLLKKVNDMGKPVILKRHFCASLKELVAHASYLTNCDVILCLRGILSLHKEEQRFYPDFCDIPKLRDICNINHEIMYDVSHSSCDVQYVRKNALASLVFSPDYLMIEVHNNPRKAFSDAKQQFTIKDFKKLRRELYA